MFSQADCDEMNRALFAVMAAGALVIFAAGMFASTFFNWLASHLSIVWH